MRKATLALLVLASAAGSIRPTPCESSAPTGAATSARPAPHALGIPLAFVERGDAAFAAVGRDRGVLLGPGGMTVTKRTAAGRLPIEFLFEGARGAAPRGEAEARARFHGFRGADAAATHARSFGRVVYDEPWPGVDLRFDARGSSVEYSLVVRAGADAAAARFAVRGADAVARDDAGRLVVSTSAGPVAQSRPVAWQGTAEGRTPVGVAFDVGPRRADGTTTYGFALGAHDPALPVTIDPSITIEPVTFGGSAEDSVSGIAFDPLGNLYAAGWTYSSDLIPAAVPAFDRTHGGAVTGFVAKFDAAGELVFASYLGDTSSVSDVGVDATGRCVVAGYTTQSASFPTKVGPDLTPSAIQYGDYFATRFAEDGASLVYSGFIGATGGGYVNDIHVAVNGSGFACVTGTATGGWSPITTTLGDANVHRGGFAVGIESDGTRRYSVVLSPSGASQQVKDVAVDAAGAAYVVGFGSPGNLPPATVSNLKSAAGVGFVAKIDPLGTGLDYAASIEAVAYGIDVDAAGSAYVTGQVYGTFPTIVNPEHDRGAAATIGGFVGKLSPDGSQVVYAGGLDMQYGVGTAVGPDGSAFVLGNRGEVVRVDPEGQSSSLLVAFDDLAAGAIDVDPSGTVAVVHGDLSATPDSSIVRITGIVPAVPLPAGVTATALSAHAVRVEWTGPADATGFVLERAGATGPFATIADLDATTTSYDDGGLSPNTVYRYRVRARRAESLSNPSAPVSARTLPTIDFRIRRGRVVDTSRESRDSISLTARLALVAGAGGAVFDPATDAVHVEVGAEGAFTLDIAAGDAGWRTRGGRFTWRGAAAGGGRVKLVLDTVRRRLVLTASRLSLPALPGNPVVTSVRFGDESVADSSSWRLTRRARLLFP